MTWIFVFGTPKRGLKRHLRTAIEKGYLDWALFVCPPLGDN